MKQRQNKTHLFLRATREANDCLAVARRGYGGMSGRSVVGVGRLGDERLARMNMHQHATAVLFSHKLLAPDPVFGSSILVPDPITIK